MHKFISPLFLLAGLSAILVSCKTSTTPSAEPVAEANAIKETVYNKEWKMGPWGYVVYEFN